MTSAAITAHALMASVHSKLGLSTPETNTPLAKRLSIVTTPGSEATAPLAVPPGLGLGEMVVDEVVSAGTLCKLVTSRAVTVAVTPWACSCVLMFDLNAVASIVLAVIVPPVYVDGTLIVYLTVTSPVSLRGVLCFTAPRRRAGTISVIVTCSSSTPGIESAMAFDSAVLTLGSVAKLAGTVSRVSLVSAVTNCGTGAVEESPPPPDAPPPDELETAPGTAAGVGEGCGQPLGRTYGGTPNSLTPDTGVERFLVSAHDAASTSVANRRVLTVPSLLKHSALAQQQYFLTQGVY